MVYKQIVSALRVNSQKALYMVPLLDQRWASVADVGPTLIQHWICVMCLVIGWPESCTDIM